MKKWVTLPNKRAIREWYYNSTPEEEALCDVATIDFDKHVRLERVNMDDSMHSVDLQTLHPIDHAFVIFYGKGYQCVHVLGALPFSRVMQLGGIVDHTILAKAHSRWCTWEYRPPATECDIPMAELPMVIYEFTDNWNAGSYIMDDVPLNELLAHYKDPEANPAPTCLLRACSVMAHFISVWIEHASNLPFYSKMADPRMLRNRFDNMRMDAEKTMLSNLMPRFTSQLSLTRFLVFNGMKTWLESNVCDPTPQDLQWFLDDYPNYGYIPTIFIQVPVGQFPARRLPMYKGGLVHIPCVWEDVLAWLWQVRQIETQRAYTEWDLQRWEALDVEIVEFIKPFASEMAFWMMQNTKSKRRRKDKESITVPENQMDIDDMEDMWRAMPPCIASLRNSHFPKNLERLQLTRIFVEAGISQKTVTEFYETHHAKYPNGQDFKSRYDIASAWKHELEAKKKPIMCWYLITAVKSKAAESLYCPFAKNSTLPDGDELRSRCYTACAGRRFGGRPALRIQPALNTFQSKPTESVEMEYFTPSVSSEEEEDGGVQEGD